MLTEGKQRPDLLLSPLGRLNTKGDVKDYKNRSGVYLVTRLQGGNSALLLQRLTCLTFIIPIMIHFTSIDPKHEVYPDMIIWARFFSRSNEGTKRHGARKKILNTYNLINVDSHMNSVNVLIPTILSMKQIEVLERGLNFSPNLDFT